MKEGQKGEGTRGTLEEADRKKMRKGTGGNVQKGRIGRRGSEQEGGGYKTEGAGWREGTGEGGMGTSRKGRQKRGGK